MRCPAKVNLFLAVGPKDERGYHPLRTIFQAIDLCDELRIEVNSDAPGFSCDDPAVPVENTVTRARSLLNEFISLPPLRITLRKRIPAQSGLGGGSSDAAGFLRAADQFLERRLPREEIHLIAAAVGADVPFFLVGGRAQAEGYGERLTPLPDGPPRWLVVARPDAGCPTPEMYRRLDEVTYEWRPFPDDDALYNDFVRVAPPQCLDLIARLTELGASAATLAGSGSAVFGIFRDEGAAQRAALVMGSDAPHVWLCRTLLRSAQREER